MISIINPRSLSRKFFHNQLSIHGEVSVSPQRMMQESIYVLDIQWFWFSCSASISRVSRSNSRRLSSISFNHQYYRTQEIQLLSNWIIPSFHWYKLHYLQSRFHHSGVPRTQILETQWSPWELSKCSSPNSSANRSVHCFSHHEYCDQYHCHCHHCHCRHCHLCWRFKATPRAWALRSRWSRRGGRCLNMVWSSLSL